MTKDLNKNISSIQYNSLNLPSKVVFSDGKYMDYVYSATGEKRSVTYNVLSSDGSYTYCDNFIYYNGDLNKILVDGGYISISGTTPTYHYYLKDHLGNNRLVVDASGTVKQVTHYYPFGGFFGESTGSSYQAYKYNGKEFERLINEDWYDYGARHMSPNFGRFTTMDPMAEKYYDISPYAYCANNPVDAIDMNGDTISYYYRGTKYIYNKYNYGFYNNEGCLLDRPFINKLSKALNTILEGNVGRALLDYLITSSTEININMGVDSKINYSNGTINVTWNPDDEQGAGIDEYGGSIVPSFIPLAHELYHAKDYVQFGSSNQEIWYKSPSGEIKRKNELYTSINENKIRAEHGLPLRRYYAYYQHNMKGYTPSLIPIYSILPISIWGNSK